VSITALPSASGRAVSRRDPVPAPAQPAATSGATLLLNATYEPLCVVSSRRAIVLVLAAKAESIDVTDDEVHAERITVAVPVVVRLTRYVRVPYPVQVPLSRRAVFTRDSSTCVYCGASATSIDHVVPRSRGGVSSGPTSSPAASATTCSRAAARCARAA